MSTEKDTRPDPIMADKVLVFIGWECCEPDCDEGDLGFASEQEAEDAARKHWEEAHGR